MSGLWRVERPPARQDNQMKNGGDVDIIKFAMQMELDGQAFYSKAAEATDNAQLKKVLLTLADEEKKHYRVFKSMSEGDMTAAETSLGEKSETPHLAKSIFQQMTEAGVETLGGDDVETLWQQALEIEQKSERMYRQAAREEPDETSRQLMHRIADEEKNHVYLCDNMLAFTRDPASFLSSAQYKNFMSWEGH
jgi:rubrerythrin